MQREGKDHQLVDLREPYEAELCTMGGTHIPMGQIIDRLSEVRRDIPVILYCRSGNRGAAVTQALRSRYGFSNVHNLRGGIMAYSQEVDHNIHCD